MARSIMFGRSGSGKSWLFGWLIERAVPEFDFAVHFDIEDEEIGLSKKGESIFKTFYVDQEFVEDEVEYKGKRMGRIEAVIIENRKVRVVPDGLTTEEKQEVFKRICALAMKLVQNAETTMWISADEAHQVVGTGDLDDAVDRVLSGGRKKGLEWGFATQRPAKLNDEAFTQANYGYYLSLTKDVDIAKANGSIGVNAYQVLPELEPRDFVFEDLDSGEVKLHTSDELEREHEHHAPDDGVADEIFESAAADGKNLRDLQGSDGIDLGGDEDEEDDGEVDEDGGEETQE